MYTHRDHGLPARTEYAVRRLRKIVNDDAGRMSRTLNAIEIANGSFIERKRNERRASITTTLKLLDVARDMVLRPGEMEAETDIEVSPEAVPENFDWFPARSKRRLKRWEADAYASLGFFDMHVWPALENLRGHLRKAEELNISLVENSSLSAYSQSLSLYWSQGKHPPEDFLAELDLVQLRCPHATPVMGLVGQAMPEFDSKQSRIRTVEEWRHLALLLLFTLDPGFDGSSIGASVPFPWRDDDTEQGFFSNRSVMKLWVSWRVGTDRIDAVLLDLLERAVVALEHDDELFSSTQHPLDPKPDAIVVQATVLPRAPEPVPEWARTACTSLPLRGWKEILNALGRTSDRNAKRLVLRANERWNGPIQRCGRTPVAFKEQLECWVRGLSENHLFREEARQNRSGAIQELEERGGQRMKDYGMHGERRPNARGKVGPAPRRDDEGDQH